MELWECASSYLLLAILLGPVVQSPISANPGLTL